MNKTVGSKSTEAMETNPFLRQFQPSDLKVASEFLTNWLPFLSRDLCKGCVQTLSNRIASLHPEHSSNNVDEDYENGGDCDNHSLGSWKESEVALGSLSLSSPSRLVVAETASPRMSWADMSQEDDELEGEEDEEAMKYPEKPKLSREQRENLRLMNVKRKKDFICLERVKGKVINVLDGLELHTGVFSAVEQKRIVDHVYLLQEKGQKGELKERTFTAPQKWMRGKGRVTIQFGCCYNYVTDRAGNPPGILKREEVDPLPSLFKVIIRRLVKWHVLPPTCVPDSCIVNIYDEGDCIPPHIDNHEFLRPFCTISFLSECNILFGSNLRVESPGEFSGSFSIPLPVGSVLVLNGNGADVAKHCVPAVPTKRISITFRKMDESKRPVWFTPEPDLQGIKPLPLDLNRPVSAASSLGSDNHNATRGRGHGRRGGGRGNNHDLRSYNNTERSSHDLRGYNNPERSNRDSKGYNNPERNNNDLRGDYNPDRSSQDSRGNYPERSNHDSRGNNYPERSNRDSRGYNNPERNNNNSRGYGNPERSSNSSRGNYNPERSNHDSRGYNNPETSNHDSRGYYPERSNHVSSGVYNPERSNNDYSGSYNPERSNHESRGYSNSERISEQYDTGEWSSNQRRGRPRNQRF